MHSACACGDLSMAVVLSFATSSRVLKGYRPYAVIVVITQTFEECHNDHDVAIKKLNELQSGFAKNHMGADANQSDYSLTTTNQTGESCVPMDARTNGSGGHDKQTYWMAVGDPFFGQLCSFALLDG